MLKISQFLIRRIKLFLSGLAQHSVTDTIYPNSSGSSAYYGTDVSLPPATKTAMDDNTCNSTQRDSMSSSVFSPTLTADGKYGGIRVSFYSSYPSVSAIDYSFTLFNGSSWDDGLPAIDNQGRLYVWNFNSSSWELLSSPVFDPSSKTVTGTISSPTNYISGNEITFLFTTSHIIDLNFVFSVGCNITVTHLN